MKTKYKSPTIGLQHHSGSQWLGFSLKVLYEKIEEILGSVYEIEKFPPYFSELAEKEKKRTLEQFIRNNQLLITNEINCLRIRNQKRINTAIYFPMLGALPRGWLGFPFLINQLTRSDIVSFSSTADHKIFNNLVKECKATEAFLPFFVDTEKFVPYSFERRKELRKRFTLEPNKIVFLYCGRITSQKNVNDIITVFSQISKKNSNAMLLIVGDFLDDKFEEFGTGPYDLEWLFNKSIDSAIGLKGKVRFYSSVSHSALPDYYNIADIFINLSLHHDENFGFSQVEAMSCGLPVIGSDWGGLKDVISDSEAGYLIPTLMTNWGVRVDLPMAIQRATHLAESKDLRVKMGALARARAKRFYSVPVFRENLLSQIREGLKTKKTGHQENILKPFAKKYFGEFKFSKKSFGRPRKPYTNKTYSLYKNLLLPYASGEAVSTILEGATLFVPGSFTLSKNRNYKLINPLWPLDLNLSDSEWRVLKFFLNKMNSSGGSIAESQIQEIEKKLGTIKNLRKIIDRLLRRGALVISKIATR